VQIALSTKNDVKWFLSGNARTCHV